MKFCKKCGKKFSDDMLTLTENGNVCPDCLLRYYRRCSICSTYFEYENSFHTLCNKCEEKIYENDINGYSTKPYPRFKNFGNNIRKDLGCRYYGLEMEFSYTRAGDVHEILKDLYKDKLLYNKSDGSLSSGVEIVTSPLDKRSAYKLLDDMEDALSNIRATSEYKRNAGLHIHVNKSSIDSIDRYKLSILLNYKSTDKERSCLLYLSNRCKEPNISGYNPTYCLVGSSVKLNYKKAILDRHIALNVRNKATLEFRIFSSSAEQEQIKSYIEMVDTMIDFCSNNGIRDINLTNYFIYLKNNTNNNVIKEKLKTFEEANGEFKKFTNITSEAMLFNIIKGSKWSEYYKILSYIQGSKNNREVQERLLEYVEDINKGKLRYNLIRPTTGNNNISRRLYSTVKSVLISRILNGAKKCA